MNFFLIFFWHSLLLFGIKANFEKKEYKAILYGDNYVGTTSLLRKYIKFKI